MKHLDEIELVLALDSEMEPAEMEWAQAHLAECGQCREQLVGLKVVSARVVEYHQTVLEERLSDSHPIAQGGPKDGAPVGVSSHGFLVPSEDQKQSPRRGPFTRTAVLARDDRVMGWMGQWKWIGTATVAVVLISVGIVMQRSHPITQHKGGAPNFSISHPSGEGGPQSGAPIDGKTNAGIFVAKNAPQDDSSCKLGKFTSKADCANRNQRNAPGTPKGRNQVLSMAQKKTPAAAKPDMALAQFTELPFSDTSLPLDEATVVRVQLPAAALRQAGVPVEEESANSILQADLLLGMDGQPRGIRLVKNGGTTN